MRQLAEALGCSPKTPYRYFKDKADILATVRAQAFAKFADALEKAALSERLTIRRSAARLTSEAYLPLRAEEPARLSHHVRASTRRSTTAIPISARRPSARRATSPAPPSSMAAAGVIDVDPTMFGWRCGRATHGMVMLHQSGMLAHGSGLPDAGLFPRRDDVEGRRRPDGAGQEGREEAMTAGVTAGERFRSWADIQANAARAAGGFAGARRRRGRQRGADAAQRLRRPSRSTWRRASSAPMPCRSTGISRRRRRATSWPTAAPRCWWPTATCWPRSRAACPADVKVLVVPTPDGDRRRLQRAGRRSGAAPAGRRDLGRLRRAQRAQHPAAQGGARQHDLHLGHDRPAQGRAAPARPRPSSRRWRRGEVGKYWGIKRRSLDRRDDERPDVPLRARRLRHGQRAARPQHGAAAALRGRGHAAADRPAQGQPHAHRADHVRAPAAPARRGEATLRPLVAALGHPWRRALRAGGEAPDDRLVGTGHQRILRRHRDRHRGLARFAGGAAPSPARSAASSRAPRCASSTSRAAT